MNDHFEGLRILLDSLQKKDPNELSLESLVKKLVYLFESLEVLLQQSLEDSREVILDEIGAKVSTLLIPFIDVTKKNVPQLLNLSRKTGSIEDWALMDEAKLKILEIGERIGKSLPKTSSNSEEGIKPSSKDKSKSHSPRKGGWMKS